MMGRFSQFLERLEEVYATAEYASFACCYDTAQKGAKLCGFAVPSVRHAKRLLDRGLEEFASRPVHCRKGVE